VVEICLDIRCKNDNNIIRCHIIRKITFKLCMDDDKKTNNYSFKNTIGTTTSI